MSGDLRDEEPLEPVDVRAGAGADASRRRGPGPVWLLVLLALWAGGVYWFYTRGESEDPEPSSVAATATPDSAVERPGPAPTPTSVPLPAATPAPERFLRLTSTPAGATVLRDGVYAGETPFRLEDPKEEETLLFRKAGHEPRRVQPDPDAESLDVELKPILGTVKVRLDPPDATVTLDGTPVEIPPGGEMNLPAREHRFRAEAPGFLPREVEITPAKAYVREVDLRLRTVPTPTPGLAPGGKEGPETPVREKNSLGMEMIRPGLPMEVVLGSPRGSAGRQSNEVERRARLERAFRISETEVSNAMFRKFKASHESGAWKGIDLNADPLPVVNLAWEDAAAFCNWLSREEGLPPAYVKEEEAWAFQPEPGTGYRLPTEAEWEGLVRRESGSTRFPWGDGLPPPAGVNVAGSESEGKITPALEGHRDGHIGPAPVEAAWRGPFEVKGLAGNVSEWMHDGYELPESGGGPAVDPRGRADRRFHVIKGAGWRDAGLVNLRTARRQYDERGGVDLGFRVARYIE